MLHSGLECLSVLGCTSDMQLNWLGIESPGSCFLNQHVSILLNTSICLFNCQLSHQCILHILQLLGILFGLAVLGLPLLEVLDLGAVTI